MQTTTSKSTQALKGSGITARERRRVSRKVIKKILELEASFSEARKDLTFVPIGKGVLGAEARAPRVQRSILVRTGDSVNPLQKAWERVSKFHLASRHAREERIEHSLHTGEMSITTERYMVDGELNSAGRRLERRHPKSRLAARILGNARRDTARQELYRFFTPSRGSEKDATLLREGRIFRAEREKREMETRTSHELVKLHLRNIDLLTSEEVRNLRDYTPELGWRIVPEVSDSE